MPLSFWTLVEAAKEVGGKAEILPTIIDLARAKLTCSNVIDGNYPNFSAEAQLAVVDVRLMLHYEPRREAVHILQEELVASHMRIAYSVPKHREYIRSGYPSEPVIAEAAAQQMFAFRTSAGANTTLQTLVHNINGGLLDRGELGELAGRALLTAAYDRAVERDHPRKDPMTPPLYSQGCSVITFIEELFEECHAKKILDSRPDNVVGGKPLRNALKGAIIAFTHFGKMADDTGTTSDAAFAAFLRHMAIICRSGEKTIDCLLPILLWDELLCEAVMSSILIQFKRRKMKGTRAKYAIKQEDVGFFPKGQDGRAAERCYLTWVLELGVQNSSPSLANTPVKVRDRLNSIEGKKALAVTPPTAKRRRTSFHLPDLSTIVLPEGPTKQSYPPAHPRYSVFVYGCSSNVYKVIALSETTSYARFLQSRDFLGEHPRQSPHSLALVRKLKPFWSAGAHCYHWLENPTLRPVNAASDVEPETIVVGDSHDSEDGEPMEE